MLLYSVLQKRVEGANCARHNKPNNQSTIKIKAAVLNSVTLGVRAKDTRDHSFFI